MANLTKIEDPLSGFVLYAFEANPKATRLDASWQRRSGTYAVLGLDYGVNPNGSFAAPIETKKLQWQFRVVVAADANRQTNLDLAHAAIVRACGHRREHRLVRNYAGGEQVTSGFVTDFADTTASSDNFRHRDFTLTWELNAPWGERTGRNPGLHRVGDTPGLLIGSAAALARTMGGATIPITGASQTFHLLADGSDGLPATTASDTGPIFTLYAPFGGDGGFQLLNTSGGALLTDDHGALVNTFFTYTKKKATGTLTFDCGALSVTDENGLDQWANLLVPDYQPWWQVVVAGADNVFTLQALGANPVFTIGTSRIGAAWTGLYH